MRSVEALAAAKVNLSLVVRSARADGLHQLAGRFQSIDWFDRLTIDPDGPPGIDGIDGRPVVAGEGNLAWLAASRCAAMLGAPGVKVGLEKQIAVAAGLGGGSADAAAALAATALALGDTLSPVAALAAGLGSDVPFCLHGGTADVSGVGEIVQPVPTVADYALALVVPPVEVVTSVVYAAWDRLGEPQMAPLADDRLPPSLRTQIAVRNDLTPAAVAVAPQIAEWRSELEAAWSRPIALSGSGPTLFGFFLDLEEARSALDAAPQGARHVRAAAPISWGWAVRYAGAADHRDLVPLDDPDGGWNRVAPGVVAAALD